MMMTNAHKRYLENLLASNGVDEREKKIDFIQGHVGHLPSMQWHKLDREDMNKLYIFCKREDYKE